MRSRSASPLAAENTRPPVSRLFRLLIRMFPASVRHDRGAEMLDVLAEVRPSGRAAVAESAALAWAGAGAWSRWLRTPDGLLRSAYFGAVVWFGFLVAIGPALRLRFLLQDWSDVLGWEVGSDLLGRQGGRGPRVVAVAFLGLALVAARRSRLAASAFGIVGVVAAASSNGVGQWSLAEAFSVEARWIGLALVAVIVLAHRCSARRHPVGLTATVTAVALVGVVVSLPWSSLTQPFSRNYGVMIHWQIVEPGMAVISRGAVLEWVSFFAVVLLLVMLVAHQATIAVLAPAVLHAALLDPVAAIVPIAIVAAAAAWRPLLQRVDIQIRWRRH